MVRQRQTKAAIEGILRRWCLDNGCEWGRAAVLDRVEWEHRRGTYGRRGPDFVFRIDGSELAEALAPAGCRRYAALNASLHVCLQCHGLALALISPVYAGLYRDRRRPRPADAPPPTTPSDGIP